MTYRVSRFRAEILGKRKAKPEPFGYPDSVFFEFQLHNWTTAFTIDNLWESDVTISKSEAEERWGLTERPYRNIAIQLNGMDHENSIRLWAGFQRMGTRPTFMPLYSDMIKLTSAVSAGAFSISNSYSNYRFHPGAMVAIVSFDKINRHRKPVNVEFRQIHTKTASTITFETALEFNHAAGSRLYPLMLLEPQLEGEYSFYSADISQISMSFKEFPGTQALPGWEALDTDPDCDTYNQIPIFPLFIEKVQVRPTLSLVRGGSKFRLGRGTIIDLKGIRPRLGFEIQCIGTSREKSVQILKFFDSRSGRLKKFWFPNPYTFWQAEALTQDSVVINSDLSEADIKLYLPYIALQRQDRSRLIRKVREIELTDTEEFTIYFEEQLHTSEADVNDIIGLTPCYLVRMDQDNYIESWSTNGNVTVGATFRELVNEKDVEIFFIDDFIDAIDPEDIADLFLVVQPGTNSLQPDLITPVAVDADQIGKWGDKRGGAITRALLSPTPPYDALYDYYDMGVVNYRAPNHDSANPAFISGFKLNTLEPLHDNGLGLTIFISMKLVNVAHDDSEEFLFRYPNAGIDSDILFLSKTELKLFEREGVENPNHQVVFNNLGEDFANYFCVALIWQPGGFCRLYKNGGLWARLPQSPYSLERSLTLEAEFFRLMNDEADPRSTGDCGIVGMSIFRRALGLDEFNGVGVYMTNAVGLNWGRVISFHD